jgi:uncharacterized protein with FMN-binding domain
LRASRRGALGPVRLEPWRFYEDCPSPLTGLKGQLVPVVEQEAVPARGLNFNAVPGATFTSDAFAQSLQSALQKAGM